MRSPVAFFAALMMSSYLLAGSRADQLTQADFLQYRDEEYRFSIHYPRLWAKVDATHKQTRFKAVSDGGRGTDDVNVVVTTLPGSKDMPPEDFLRLVDPDAYLAYVQQNVPDAKLLDHGRTTLSNQAAYYFVTDVTHHALGMDVSVRQTQVQTVRAGNVYTITFRSDPSDPDRYAQGYTVFQLIAAGFVLWPDPPNTPSAERPERSRADDANNVALRSGLSALLLIGLFALGAGVVRFAVIGRPLSKAMAFSVTASLWVALLVLLHRSGTTGARPWISAGVVVAFFLLTAPKRPGKHALHHDHVSEASGDSNANAP